MLRILAIAVAGLVVCLWCAPATAAAARNGWGFAVADDSSFPWGNAQIDSYFGLLAPKTYRLQVSYDAWTAPVAAGIDPDCPTEAPYRDQIVTRIKAARAAGVQHILVTLAPSTSEWHCGTKPPGGFTRPTQGSYKFAAAHTVAALAPLVDSWSPANEPNGGVKWLPGNTGAKQLAGFYIALQRVLPASQELISPEFIDRPSDDLNPYLAAYTQAVQALNPGDRGWGAHAALHPYSSVEHEDWSRVENFLDLVPPGTDVWFTEAGAHPDKAHTQASQVDWLVDQASSDPQISRIYYYNMWNDGSEWDSGLLEHDGTPRPSFCAWYRASHAGLGGGVCPFWPPVESTQKQGPALKN